MCGIVGMITSNTYGFQHTSKKIFNQLLWADTLRGDDGTGVFGVNKYGNVDYLKNQGSAAVIQQTKDYEEFDDNIFSDFHMVVGHNRSATRGMANDENTHPFIEGNTILVHNGTLTNHASLTDQKVEVDSHAILHSIVERGYEETLKEIQGAFTLVWYNTDDKTLRIVRNDMRPMYIASCVGAWYFASEHGMLRWILGRGNEKIEDMTECQPGVLYSFKLDDKENMWFQDVELYVPPKIEYHYTKPDDKKKDPPKLSPTTNSKDSWEGRDFVIGTKVLVCGQTIQKLQKKNESGFDHLFFGTWFFDESINVKCWATSEEIEILEKATADDIDEEEILFQADIMCVMTKKDRITLICKNISPYTPMFDMLKQEIHEDEFMLSDKACSYCGTILEFPDLQKGVFTYTKADDFLIECEHCLDRGAEKLV